MTETVIPAARGTFALVASSRENRLNPDQVPGVCRVPVIGWLADDDEGELNYHAASPVIPYINNGDLHIAVILPDGYLLCDGIIFDDPSEFADYVRQIQKRRKTA